MRPFSSAAVADRFAEYPMRTRKRMLALRELIFATAARTDGVGPLEETLKWGEPAYLTSTSKSGSTIRIDAKAELPTSYAMYFNCQTTLVERFRTVYPTTYTFDGNRALLFNVAHELPIEATRYCIAAALTYHTRATVRARS